MNARGTSGAVAVEFAFIGLAFVSLLLLAMETGWQLLIDSALGAGARAASRFGSTGTKVAAGITNSAALGSRSSGCNTAFSEGGAFSSTASSAGGKTPT